MDTVNSRDGGSHGTRLQGAGPRVATVLEALAAEVKESLSATGAITILGLVKIEKKTVPACPTWPAYVKVTVAPELLPGPDGYCVQGLHTYHESPATNERGHPVCGSCGKDESDWDRLHARDIMDATYAVTQLKTDRFRHKWWSKDFDPAAVRHARRKGLAGMKEGMQFGWGGDYEPPPGKRVRMCRQDAQAAIKALV